MLWKKQKYTKATQLLNQKAPENIDAQILSATIYTDQKKYGDATLVLSNLHTTLPDNRDILVELINVLSIQGKFTEAISYQSKILTNSGYQQKEVEKIIEIYRNAKDLSGLRSLLQRVSDSKYRSDYTEYQNIQALSELKDSNSVITRSLLFFDRYKNSQYKNQVNVFYKKALQSGSTKKSQTKKKTRRRRRRRRRR